MTPTICRPLLTTAVAVALASPAALNAETLAYWRFDDRPLDDKLDADLGTEHAPFSTIADASGRGNVLRTFNTRAEKHPPDTSGRIVASRGLPPLAGDVANERNARFVGSQDFYTSEAGGKQPPINSAVLKTFTVEGMFKVETLSRRWKDRAQVIVGKNGRAVRRLPWQPFAIVSHGSDSDRFDRDCLSVNMVDESGTYRIAASKRPLEANRWYAFAAVCDGQTLKLYLNRFDGTGYQLEGESPVEGGMIATTNSWVIGRGAYNGQPNSWLQGEADEIRISNVALPPDRWLTAGIDVLPASTPATQPAARPQLLMRQLADPDAILHDGTYYVYGTDSTVSFDVWSSRDLVNWTKTPDVLKAGPGVWGDADFWAPGAIEHKGKFYLHYSTRGVMPDRGGLRSVRINVAVAEKPTGPFKEVVARMPLLGRAVIDPQIFIDDDGTPYMYFVADIWDNNGSGQIYVVRMSDDLLTPIGEPWPCLAPSQQWEGTTWNEGPFVFRDGKDYVMTYSGEFWGSHGYAVGTATAPTPFGPWKKRDDNPFMYRYAGLYGTGHNSIARTPDGKGWLIFYHAHHNERVTRRDSYVARLVVERDARGDVRLRAEPFDIPEEKPTAPAGDE